MYYLNLGIDSVDYTKYPDEHHQKKWIGIYLRESALCEGNYVYIHYCTFYVITIFLYL